MRKWRNVRAYMVYVLVFAMMLIGAQRVGELRFRAVAFDSIASSHASQARSAEKSLKSVEVAALKEVSG